MIYLRSQHQEVGNFIIFISLKHFPYFYYSLFFCSTLPLSEITVLYVYYLSLSLKGNLSRAVTLSYLLLYPQNLEQYLVLSSAQLITEKMHRGN